MLFRQVIEQVFTNINGKWEEIDHIAGVSTDSREDLTNKLFIPLKGESFDGHNFLEQAIEKGAVAALWQKDYPRPKVVEQSFPLILVEDTLTGLQKLATSYLTSIDPKVIAITGSNGKTTTKDLVYAVTRQAFHTHCTKGNFNNHIGLPLTILSMPPQTELLILEMGMNHFGEIEQLTKIAQPELAIITNIGESHIEHLGSRAGIAQAKLEITSNMNKNSLLIYDGDEPLLEGNYPFKTISVGFEAKNNYQITKYDVTNEGTKFNFNHKLESIFVPLFGKHQAKNAAYSWLVGNQLGMNADQIQAGLLNLEKTGMRFEQIAGKNGAVLINDAYNASPTSMRVTIEVFSELQGFDTKILVLGDMLELGDYSSDYHRQVGRNIPDTIDYVYTIGIEAEAISQSTTVQAKHFTSKADLITKLKAHQTEGTIILFKASRGMKFEELIDAIRN